MTTKLFETHNFDDLVNEIAEQNDTLKAMLYADNHNSVKSVTDISNLAYRGIADKVIDFGDSFTLPWSNGKDSYDVQHDIVHIGDVTLESGDTTQGVTAMWHHASPLGVQFSHPRAILRCPDGLSAGTYYFTIESAWGNNVSAGDVVCFSTSIDVPKGGRVAGCYGAPDQAKDNWRIHIYDADGIKILETTKPSFTASGANLGTIKNNTRNGDLNSIQEIAYGYNRWSHSAIRQYLNSDKTKGNWWKQQDEWDIAPDELSSVDGFLYGMDEELRASIIPTKIRTALNSNVGASIKTYEDTYDLVFLPSLEQLYITPQLSGTEGNTWDYFKDLREQPICVPWWKDYVDGGFAPFYAIENKTSAQNVRLRSAYRYDACGAWNVYASGHVSNHYASNSYRFTPACVIGKL